MFLADLTKCPCREKFNSYQAVSKLPFICALMPHFLQHNVVFTCNKSAVTALTETVIEKEVAYTQMDVYDYNLACHR